MKHTNILTELVIEYILESMDNNGIDSNNTIFSIEKLLTEIGFPLNEVPVDDIISIVKQNYNNTTIKTSLFNVIKTEVDNVMASILETKTQSASDKMAVRNKKTGSIQLISKRTYQKNSQIYTPLSAGWAKSNILMIRNKVSGEEYPVLLKNFDPNKHEKISSETPPDKKEDEKETPTKKMEEPPSNKSLKTPKPETPPAGKSTVRPFMVEPSLKSSTPTAFIKKRDVGSASDAALAFAQSSDELIKIIQQRVKDKRLNKKDPLKSKEFSIFRKDREYDIEKYNELQANNLIPKDFKIEKAFVIPTGVYSNAIIPKKYLKTLEYLINSNNAANSTIQDYNLDLPLSFDINASLSLFELLLLLAVTLNNEDFSKLTISIELFINTHPEASLTYELWEIVKQERDLIIAFLSKKYGNAFKLVAGAWKVEEDQNALGIDNSDIDPEKISDIFLRVSAGDSGDFLEEFLVTPNGNGVIARFDKNVFKQYLADKKINKKDKMLLLLFKLYPLQAILKNEAVMVFSNCLHDYYVYEKLFKVNSITELGLELKVIDNEILLTYAETKDRVRLVRLYQDGDIRLQFDPEFYLTCQEQNKKLYKNKLR